jgi:formamidopyrimidine-DNA glycosylase
MPELPEVEVLARHLAPLLHGRVIKSVVVRRAKVLHPTKVSELELALAGARFQSVRRRGKYLIFELSQPPAARRKAKAAVRLIGHLGMTGRMYLLPKSAPSPKHTAVELDLGRHKFIYEDPRYFGRFTLNAPGVAALGPEPLEGDFTPQRLRDRLAGCKQAIKVKLLDQSLVAGVGNIYASEALFRAGISPRKAAGRLRLAECARLHQAIRDALSDAIQFGSTIALDFAGAGSRDGLFYYGQSAEAPDYYTERLLVYDKAGKACGRCGGKIKRIVQANRSTFFCPGCQK